MAKKKLGSTFGPYMAALPERERDFVMEYAMNGCNAIRAYQQVYPAIKHPATLNRRIDELMHEDRIVAAIREESHFRFGGMTSKAIAVYREVLDDPMHKERVKVATAVLDRTGYGMKTEHHVVVEHKADDNEMLERAKLLALEMGMDPQRLIGYRPELLAEVKPTDVIEGEFEEINIEDLL